MAELAKARSMQPYIILLVSRKFVFFCCVAMCRRIVMAQSAEDESGTISRQALGRIANLGDLYDATTDRFCAVSIFNQKLPPDSPAITVTDNQHSKISFTTFSSLDEKLKELDVAGTLKLSVLAGLVDLRGSAKYLTSKKNSFKSVESALLYNIKTVVERLNLHSFCATSTFDTLEPNSNTTVTNNNNVTPLISQDSIRRSGATHVVVEIYWGATCTVTVTDENSEDEEKREVEGSLKLQLEKLKKLIAMIPIAVGDADASVSSGTRDSGVETRFSIEIFGDVLLDSSDEFPTTLERAVETIKRIPELILAGSNNVEGTNNGKGVPLTYVMIPLSSLPFQNSQLKLPVFRKVDEGHIFKIIHLFDNISELQQKARDFVDELDKHGHCVTRKELFGARSCEQRLEAQLGSAKSHLAKLLGAIRSDNSNSESSVEEFCNSSYKNAEKTFEECEKIYKSQQKQIEFAKRCTKAGAKYLPPPIDDRIARACDEYGNVYVLFDGEFDRDADGETLRRNHSAFIELAKSCQNVNCLNADKTVCYVVWPEQKESVRIEHYRKGNPTHKDVVKELEAENVAQCIPAARRVFSMMPFQVACPDGYCSGDELLWTCINCKETLQFCSDDRAIYCSCGHSRADRFQFRCHNETHGLDFCKFGDDVLQSVLDRHASLAREGKYLVK